MSRRPPHPPQRVLLIAAHGLAIERSTGGCALFFGTPELVAAIAPQARRLHGGMGVEGRRLRRREIMAAVDPLLDERDRVKVATALRTGDIPFLDALAEARALSFAAIAKVVVDDD